MTLMNTFGLTEEQQMMRESLLTLLGRHLPWERVRKMDEDKEYPLEAHQALADARPPECGPPPARHRGRLHDRTWPRRGRRAGRSARMAKRARHAPMIKPLVGLFMIASARARIRTYRVTGVSRRHAVAGPLAEAVTYTCCRRHRLRPPQSSPADRNRE